MNDSLRDRVISVSNYFVENKSTVRNTAKIFRISKSTVFKDLSERLAKIDPVLHKRVKKILQINKSERHIRGGIATKKKYISLSKND